MVSRLGSAYSDLLSNLPQELKERVNASKFTHRDFLEIARSVVVKEEPDGSISVSQNVLSEKDIRKAEISKVHIELIRRICSAADEKIVDKSEELPKECTAVSMKIDGNVAIVRRRDKRKADSERDCDHAYTLKEQKQKKLLSQADRAQIAEDVKEVFLQKSKIPNTIKLKIADYIEETPKAIIDFVNEERLPSYLKDVVDLDLSKEKLDYATFCKIIDECKNLQSLTLPQYVDDLWLEEIAHKLSHLKSLSVSNCSTTSDAGLKHIASLNLLEKLSIKNCNNITDEVVDLIIQKLEVLRELDISMCFISGSFYRISDKAFENIGMRSETLVSIKLNNLVILTDYGVNKIITELDNLQELSLENCGYSDEGLINIGRLGKSLQTLKLFSKITGEFLTHIDQDFNVLKIVDFSNCYQFKVANFAHSANKFSALENLDLTSCKIDNYVFTRIAQECRNLKKLRGCNKITNSGLEAISKNCLDLREIDLSSCSEIDDEGLKSLSEHCHKLEFINLSNCKKITDEGLKSISVGCPELFKLNIDSCFKVTDLGIQHLSQGIKSLQIFEVKNCEKITSIGLGYISEWRDSLIILRFGYNEIDDTVFANFESNFPVLKEIVLKSCKNMKGDGLNRISQLFPALENLNLWNCDKLTDDGIRHLKDLPELSRLNLFECSKITNAVVDHIKAIPNIKSVGLTGCSVSDSAKANLRSHGIEV